MGWSLPKVKLPKIKAPKITVGDPTKLATKPFEGVTNAAGSIIGNGVAQIGGIMQQPGAGAVLGMAGTAAGIPGAGLLASSFVGNQPQVPPVNSAAIPPQNYSLSGSMPQVQGSNNTVLYIGLAVGVLGLILTIFLMKKK